MATIKSFTDISQSKILSKILPLESADFMWEYEPDKETYWDKPTMIPIDSYIFVNDIPCWSLAALLGVLPEGTRLLKSATDNTYHYDCPKGNIDKWFDNPIDACVAMIEKLNELNLL